MTKLLDVAVEAVRNLPPRSQDQIAAAMLELAKGAEDAEPIASEHLAGVLEGLEQAKRGEFATEDEIAEVFKQFDQ